jgi:hypothetical protein
MNNHLFAGNLAAVFGHQMPIERNAGKIDGFTSSYLRPNPNKPAYFLYVASPVAETLFTPVPGLKTDVALSQPVMSANFEVPSE